MEIIIIPDIHGTEHWRKITKPKIINFVDKVIFLGDYFDTWINQWPQQMDNVLDILKFKKIYPDKVCLCLANHDTSYILNEQCSGYQGHHAVDIEELFNINKNLFEVIFIFNKWIFSHGGVSEKWMACAGIKSPHEINELFKTRPNFFRWVGPNNYGDNLNEGPLWIRPRSLTQTAVRGYNQVVGHTESGDNPKEHKTMWKNKIITIDTKAHDCIIQLNTETNKFKKLES